MAVVAARGERKRGGRSEYCIELGILNNMPDAALERTEQQFFSLLTAAAQDLLVRVHFFSLETLPRNAAGRAHCERHGYTRAAELPDCRPDALIVTGSEPRHADLKREPYWNEFGDLFGWIAEEGPSTLFSCLAAHAAVLHYDGIARIRLAEKRCGVFEHVTARRDPLTASLAEPLRIAHSRWNEVREADLAASGYRILTKSADAGVELFAKRGRNALLFCQGHPEYDAGTLAREYRRDVRRWLAGEVDTYPLMPKNYFSPAEILSLEQFRARAAFERNDALLTEFPSFARKADATWNAPGIAILRAWLKSIVESKRTNHAARRAAAAPDLASAAA